MADTEQENIWTERRTAVVERGQGIAIFRCTSRGLQCRTSSDGVAWTTESYASAGAGMLQPVCAGGTARNADLFCLNDMKSLVPVRARKGRLAIGESFRLAGAKTAAQWYEAPPEPLEQAIIRDVRAGAYRAFFCARRNVGRDPERRGCIGAATSRDLRRWNLEPPVFAPNRRPRLFSPHVFSEAGGAVLFYATPETGDLRALRFAVAPSLEGPYERLEPDLLACDVRSAIQTVRLGSERLAFFSRAVPGEAFLGSLSRPGRVAFRPSGRPFVQFYEPLLNLMGSTLFQTDASLSSGEVLVRILPRHGANFRLSARVRSLSATALGLLFRATITGSDNITLWLDFETGSISLRRGVRGRLLARARRTLTTGTNYRLSLWVEGSFIDVYLDNEWVLTGPTEVRRSGGFGLAVKGGEARFDDVSAQVITTP